MLKWPPTTPGLDRIGPKAAASYAAYSRVIIISGVAITPVAIICLGLGFRSKIIPLYRARVSPDCLVVRAPVCSDQDFYEVLRRSIRSYLGFTITRRNFPPRNQRRYAEWRKQHGIN